MVRLFRQLKEILTNPLMRNIPDNNGKNLRNDSIANNYPKDMEDTFIPIYEKSKIFTMTSVERCYALFKAIEYIHEKRIGGDIVECGVWKGGSAMICAYTLLYFGECDRNIFLYDTFSGMVEPSSRDISSEGENALKTYTDMRTPEYNQWCYAPLNEVQTNMISTGYPGEKIKLIKGRVEETIPKYSPQQIALLRMDTDWYKSTFHQFEYLYPLVSKGGVVIIDDYGYWQGCKDATNDYFRKQGTFVLLNRIDESGRIFIKTE